MSLPLLAALALVQDPLASWRETIERAETVRIEFAMEATGKQWSNHGRLLLKGKDRLFLELEDRRGKSTQSLRIYSSAGRLVVHGTPRRPSGLVLDADRHARLRALIAVVPVPASIEALIEQRVLPEIRLSEVRDLGRQKTDGRDARVVEYTAKVGTWTEAKIAMHVDPETGLPLRRIVDVNGASLVETCRAFVLGEPIPDEAFVYATRGRLAAALARQLARSVDLHQRFTGLAPASLEALTARPDGLDAAVLWPEGGFVLGGRVPPDPWGRPYALEEKDGETRVVSLGADGRPGGAGDAADVSAPVPARRPDRIAPPTERLRNHYAARVSLHLVAAAARAYAEAYGEGPSDLTKLPEGIAHGPEGGWLPGGLPRDPWGEPLQLRVSDAAAVVQVKDGRTRGVRLSMLTPEERAGLEANARAAVTPALRAAIAASIAELSGDDPDGRDRAEGRLRRQVTGRPELLDGAIGRERDPETKARLERVRASVPVPIPAWRLELGRLTAVATPAGSSEALSSNERNASYTLKTFASAQADFRGNDRDGNKVQDFWAGDVAGLYSLTADGRMIKLIELSAALADAEPLKPGDAKGRIAKIEGVAAPKAGYYFQAMTADASVAPRHAYRQDTQGEPDLGALFNYSRFGICAFPAEYGLTGTKTFIISENNTIYWSDTGGEPALEWPDDATLAAEWRKLD